MSNLGLEGRMALGIERNGSFASPQPCHLLTTIRRYTCSCCVQKRAELCDPRRVVNVTS